MLVDLQLYLEDLKASGMSPKTIKDYKTTLEKFLGGLGVKRSSQVASISKQDIQKFRLDLQERGLSASTINTYTAPIAGFFAFLFNEGYISSNPAKNLKRYKITPKPMVYLTEEEAQALVKACRTKRQKAMFYLMLSTGMRVGEVCALRMEDIVDGKVYIRSAKRDEFRYIPLTSTALRYIQNYIGKKARKKNDGTPLVDKNGNVVYTDGERIPPIIGITARENYLFTSNNGAKLDSGNLNRELKWIRRDAGIEKEITCHNLRSTAATLQSIHGTNLKNIQTMLGHKSIEMTTRYVQMVDENYQKEITQNDFMGDFEEVGLENEAE